jgi:hypothetical protein
MKATLNLKDGAKTVNKDRIRKKLFNRSLIVVNTKTKKELVEARFYDDKSPDSNTTHCLLYVMEPEGWGYGYGQDDTFQADKYASCFENAAILAGVTFSERIHARGLGIVRDAILAIAVAMGNEEYNLMLVEAHA